MSAAKSGDIKAAEQRGYSNGYQSGRRRGRLDGIQESRERDKATQERDLWDSAMLAALPYALECQGWSFGETPISNGDDRVKLAAAWADSVVRERKKRYG